MSKVESSKSIKEMIVETRREKLIRLSGMRVGKALKAIELIGNLGAYGPTTEDIKKIQDAVERALINSLNRLRGQKDSRTPFTL